MGNEVVILIIEAVAVYFLVLWAHSLRLRFGPVHFYALLGGITAVMAWVTNAGLAAQAGGITFVWGATIFYTSLLLGLFVVYTFDGPRATWIAISTVMGIAVMVPVIAAVLHFQTRATGRAAVPYIPLPDLRVNVASLVAMALDMIFLGMAWEYLGKTSLRLRLWGRVFLTFLGVMVLDVFLFVTGGFAGTPAYAAVMKETLISRLILSLFAFPVLYVYIHRQSSKIECPIENRPVLAILKQVAEIKQALSDAHMEIRRRQAAEAERDRVIGELQQVIAEVKTLRGLIPICAYCKKIRDDKGFWNQLEAYIRDHSEAEFSHGICPDCAKAQYAELRAEALPRAEP